MQRGLAATRVEEARAVRRNDPAASSALATLLGPVSVSRGAKIGAGSFLCMRDVPPDCTAVGALARIAVRGGQRVDEEMPRTELSHASVSVALADEAPARAARS